MKKIYPRILLYLVALVLFSGCGKSLSDNDYVLIAQDYLEKGELQAASIELKNALQQNPENAQARWLLGKLYEDKGNGVSAEKELRRARSLGVVDEAVFPPLAKALLQQKKFNAVLELKPDAGFSSEASADLLTSHGLALLALERMDDARQHFDRAIQLDEKFTRAMVGNARLSAAEGRFDEAHGILRQVFEIDQQFGGAWSLLGDIERQHGDFEAAEVAYTKALKYKRIKQQDLFNRAKARLALKRYREAEVDLEQYSKLVRDNLDLTYVRGLLYFHQAEYGEAQLAFERVLSDKPDYSAAAFYAGASHFMLGNHETAEYHLSRYVARDPDYLPAIRMLAVSKMVKGNYLQAERLIKSTARDDDMDVFTLTLLANAMLGQNKHSEGMDYLQQLVTAQPESASARVDLGMELIKQGEADAGIAELEAAAELDPEDQQATARLIAVYLQSGKLDKALELAVINRDRHDNTVVAHILMGTVHMAMKDIDKAGLEYQRALEIEPGNVSANNGLAAIAMQTKDLEKAKVHYRDALEKHPGDMNTLINIAVVEMAQGNKDGMQSALRTAINHNPEALKPRLILGRSYLKERDPEKLVAMLAEVKEKYNNNQDFLILLAQGELAIKDYAAAKNTLIQLSGLVKSNPALHFSLARAYEGLGDRKGYRTELEETLKLAPSHTSARIALAKLMMLEEDLVNAAEQIEILKEQTASRADVLALEGRLAELSGDNVKANKAFQMAFDKAKNNFNLVRLSHAKWEAGNRGEAVKMLEEWMLEYPNDPLVGYELANRYLILGRNQKAIETFKSVVASSPNNILALNNLAWLLRDDDPDSALQYAERATRIAPQSDAFKDTYAMVLLSKGDTDRALRAIEKVVTNSPDNLTFRLHKAIILKESGNVQQALEELRSLLQHDDAFQERGDAEQLYQELSSVN